jgi:hypothetical protein
MFLISEGREAVGVDCRKKSSCRVDANGDLSSFCQRAGDTVASAHVN